MRADADSSCTESCTDCWHHWLGSLCAQAARRTSRSSCCATNSVCCAARSTDSSSPTPTGACSQRSRPRSRDRAEPGGWSPPTHCCGSTGAASAGTGPNHSDRRADHRPQLSFADSHCASQPRIRPGATAASTASSRGSATALRRPRSGRSSTTPESTPHPHARKSPGRSSCGPRPRSPATSPPSTPSRCAGSTCCSSSTSPPGPCTSHRSRTTPPASGPPKRRGTCCSNTATDSPTPGRSDSAKCSHLVSGPEFYRSQYSHTRRRMGPLHRSGLPY